MGLFISIRYKILTVISLLLAVCVAVYLYLATFIFKQDKTQLIFDLNRSLVSNMASDLDAELRGVSGKLDLLSVLWAQKKSSTADLIQQLLEKDPHIVFVATGNVQYSRKDFLEAYSLDESYFSTKLQDKRPVPFQTIQEKGEALWNATIADGPPLLGFGRSVIEEGPGHVPVARHVVVSYLQVDSFLKTLSSSSLSEVAMVDDKGQVLVHPKAEAMSGPADFSSWPLFKMANTQSSVKTGVLNYAAQDGRFLGAFSRAYQGKVFIVSRVSEEKAFAAIQNLTKRSLIYALMVATVAFIVAILFSRSLTGPLRRLLVGMDKVARGDLKTQVRIRTNDEIARLANQFNSMTRDLMQSRIELEDINRDLEQKVLDRTRKLEEQNRAVKEAQEALLRTTRLASVGEIAGRAAHEVLNPLTNVMNRVRRIQERLEQEKKSGLLVLSEIQKAWDEDLKSGGWDKISENFKKPSSINPKQTLLEEDVQNLSAVTQEWQDTAKNLETDLQFLVGECQRINKIVSQMRSLSVVKGDQKIFSAKTLLKECLNIMGDLFLQSHVQVEEVFDLENDWIKVDRDEFIQGMTNLLRNSVQAMQGNPKGNNPKLRLVLGENAGQIFIDVEDNGCGIEKVDHSKLFVAQFTTKSHGEGTGLGLSISRRFFRSFGGDLVLLESRPQQKTVFRITLPHPEEGSQRGAVA